MESLFQELVQQGLLKHPDDVKLENYLGIRDITPTTSTTIPTTNTPITTVIATVIIGILVNSGCELYYFFVFRRL